MSNQAIPLGYKRTFGSLAFTGFLSVAMLILVGIAYGFLSAGESRTGSFCALFFGLLNGALLGSILGLIFFGPAACVAFMMALLNAPRRFESRFFYALLPMIPPVALLMFGSLVSALSWGDFWVLRLGGYVFFCLAASAGFTFLGLALLVLDRLRDHWQFFFCILLIEALFCCSCLAVVCLLGARGWY